MKEKADSEDGADHSMGWSLMVVVGLTGPTLGLYLLPPWEVLIGYVALLALVYLIEAIVDHGPARLRKCDQIASPTETPQATKHGGLGLSAVCTVAIRGPDGINLGGKSNKGRVNGKGGEAPL